MISAKELTEEQRSAIEQWVEEGSQLPDIQKRLKEQFGLTLTFMDTRFLMLDLGIEIQSPQEENDEETERSSQESDLADQGELEGPASDPFDAKRPMADGEVSVRRHEITQPGALVSGSVTFSDGEEGIWLIDRTGRPALELKNRNYEPSEPDLIALEKQLRRLLGE